MNSSILDAAHNSPHDGIECRVTERQDCEVATQCQPAAARGDDEVVWEASIKDISNGGAGLVCVRRFEPGCGLSVQIATPNDPEGGTYLLRVVWALREGEDWRMGCSFISPLSDDEVSRLAAAFCPPTTKNN